MSAPTDEYAAAQKCRCFHMDTMYDRSDCPLHGSDSDKLRLLREAEAQRELDHRRTETLIQHPETGDFLRGALVEAAYQREAWPDQDAAKGDSDWFWTLGYIVGKAVKGDDDEARLHHIEAGAALLANWHNAVKGRVEVAPSQEADRG